MDIIIAELAKGSVHIENDVLAKIAGIIATNCYGVVGMAYRSKTDEFASLLKKDSLTKGIKVDVIDDSLKIGLHIIVDYGININTICNNIKIWKISNRIIGSKNRILIFISLSSNIRVCICFHLPTYLSKCFCLSCPQAPSISLPSSRLIVALICFFSSLFLNFITFFLSDST